jgi:sRNA-binding protein
MKSAFRTRLMLRDLAGVLGCKPADLPPAFLTAKPKPLAIGVHVDLHARYPGADPVKLLRWLKAWTGHRLYLFAVAQGGARYDLAGKPVAMISDKERMHAARVLKRNRISIEAPAPKRQRAGKNGRPILSLPAFRRAP